MIYNKIRIGCIGQGFVGSAIKEKFKEDFTIFTFDKASTDKSQTYWHSDDEPFDFTEDLLESNTIETLVKYCDVIFVCVPTPMFKHGECDTRIVETVIKQVAEECEKQNTSVIVTIKSTVPPGTTMSFNDISKNVTVTFSPEFLTEANAVEDFKNQTRIILGIDYLEVLEPLHDIFKIAFPEAEILIMNSPEAEMVKYTTNLFLATKVSFFNDIYSVCQSLNINYDQVIEGTMRDPRIGKSHYMVPGPDGDRGFGGHCFPKDLAALLHIAAEEGISTPTILGAQITNTIVRQNKDWEDMKGRAVSED